MNKKLKEKWIKALYSGRYSQGRQFLKDSSDNYCCLGVLCDIIDPTKWKTSGFIAPRYMGMNDFLPKTILNKAGLNHEDEVTLSKKNDNGDGFDEIACWIEMHL